MKLLSYNIQYGKGRDGRFDLERIASEASGADIIALQEVERFWKHSGGMDQVQVLAAAFPDHYWAYGAGVDVHNPAAAGVASGLSRRQFGNMLLSRWPLLYSRHHLLPKYASTGPLSIQRSALECVIETPLFTARFYSVHLSHLAAATRMPQVERLLALHRGAVREGAPVTGDLGAAGRGEDAFCTDAPREAVFLGDFNFEPDAPEYERMAGPFSEHYGGRMTNPDGLVDAWAALAPPDEHGCTTDIAGRPVRLDYCFVSTVLAPRLVAARVDDEARGSDHQPLWIEMA